TDHRTVSSMARPRTLGSSGGALAVAHPDIDPVVPMSARGASADRALGATRPRLRGWIHGAAAPVAVVVAVLLARQADVGAPRLSVVVFGVGLVGLYAISAIYHVPKWPAPVRRLLGRVDVAMIQLFIAASFTPVAVHALHGAWRTWSLVVAWALAIIGAAVAASPLKGPRWLGVAGYASFGALAAAPLLRAVQTLPLFGTVLLVIGALAYLGGGIIYARQRPNPWPQWFAFHEVFHVMVVLASAVHVAAIWRYVLPLA
ncbi:MAG: hemolysin III family protein, partial [Trueperaceae bacterium]